MKNFFRRRTLILVVGITLVVAGIGFDLLLMWPPTISQANYDRIQIGWTLAEVEELLGPPVPSKVSNIHFWGNVGTDTIIVAVDFNGPGVTHKWYTPNPRPPAERLHLRIEEFVRRTLRLPPRPIDDPGLD